MKERVGREDKKRREDSVQGREGGRKDNKMDRSKRMRVEGGGERVGHDDEEHGVDEQQGDLEGDPLPAVWRKVEAHDVHDHQEDAGQQQVHRVEQRPSSDHHLQGRHKRQPGLSDGLVAGGNQVSPTGEEHDLLSMIEIVCNI